jgi:transposase
VDLHRKRSHVVALDPAGAVVLSRRIGNAPAEFWRIFGELEPEPIEVVFEATYGWSWFADLLADAGIPAHMAHPLATKAISAARVKNDAVDAKTLAHLLRTNLLAEAWIAPPAAREARRLVRTRAGLVRMRSRVQSQLHALLADLGVIPELTTLFGPAGRRWLAELPMAASARGRLEAGLRLIDAITIEVGRADADLRAAFADADLRACFAGDHRVRRLLPIPGVGLVTAATVVAEVWDIQRFPSPERLCSWAGLTPGERTSDAHTRRGHITKQGSRWLRWMLVEAATSAVRDPQLGRFTSQRRGPKIARVALARRLLTLCYYALRDDGGCRAYPAPSRS